MKEALREAHFNDSFAYSNKQRFGLFSMPYSVACGDTNYFVKTKSKKNEDGEVETAPRNFFAGALQPGPTGRVDRPGFIYLHAGNPY